MAKRRKQRVKPHQFGRLNVRGVRVTSWKMPPNTDDDCGWYSDRDDCRARGKRKR